MSEQTALQKALWDALMSCRRRIVKDFADGGPTWRMAKANARTKDTNLALSTNPGTQLVQTSTGILARTGIEHDSKWTGKGTNGSGTRVKDLLLGGREKFAAFLAAGKHGCNAEDVAILTFMSRSHQNNIQLVAGFSLIAAFGSAKALRAHLTELYGDEDWATAFAAICLAQHGYVSKLYVHDGGEEKAAKPDAEATSYTMQSVWDEEQKEKALAKDTVSEE